MGGKGNINRSLPTNQYLAALKANNPSKTNVFVTMIDLTTSIGGLTLDEVLKKGNRAVSKPISVARNNKLGFGDESDKDNPVNYIALDDQGNLDVYVDNGLVQFLNNAFYFGDSQTDNHSKIEGTFTAGRTQRLPDKDGTFAMLSDIQDGIQASESVLLNTNPAIYADGAEGSIDPAGGVSGWYYKNDGQDKVNWYYVVNSSGNAMPLSSIKGMYAVIRPVAAMQPYFNLYTQRQFDGQDAGTFYRSRITYNTNNVLDAYVGQPVLLYWGEDPDVYTNFPHVEMTKEEFSSVGPQAPSEEVATGTLSTSSNSTVGLYEFTVSNLGYIYGDERIDHILVAVTEAANNLSFESGIEEDTLTNTVRLGGPLTKDTEVDGSANGFKLKINGFTFVKNDEGGADVESPFTRWSGEVISITLTDDFELEANSFTYTAASNVPLNSRGMYYASDYSTDWDASTLDSILATKGFVNREIDSNKATASNGLNKDGNDIQMGGPLNKSVTLIDGQNLYSWGVVNIKEGAIISREGFQISDLDNLNLSSNRRITLSGTDNRLQDYKENVDNNIKGWYYSGRSGSDFDYEDFTVNWDDVTDDAMISSKGYVDRHNAYTVSFGRRGNLNIGNYMRTSANINMRSTSGAVVGAKSLLVGLSIKIQSNNSPGSNYTIKLNVLNTDGTVKKTNYYIINQVGIPYVRNLTGTSTEIVEMGEMITAQFVDFGGSTPVTTLRNTEVCLKFQKIQ